MEEKHWPNTNTLTVEIKEKNQALKDAFNVDGFNYEEFESALKSMKNNKQPGPDGLTMELFKWMNKQNRARILDIVNGWWSTSQNPEDACLARVVSLYKKGDTYLPSNDRPISILFTKINMCLIRKRLQVVLDPTLSATQYGFRPSRSTFHAIYFTRRVQDIAEQRGSNLIITLLDWESL